MIQFTYKLKPNERVRANAVATSTATRETRHWRMACVRITSGLLVIRE